MKGFAMRTKDGRPIPAGTKALALALALLLALAVLGISPAAARAEEPAGLDAAVSEPPTETSTAPEPEETDTVSLTPASETPAEASLPPQEEESDDGAFSVTTVNGLPCVADEVLVQFKRSTSDAEMQSTLQSVDAGAPEEIKDNLHLAEIPEGETISGYIETLEDQPDVLFAQPNYVYYLADTNIVPASNLQENRSPEATYTNDSYLVWQWHLAKIGAYTAWDTTMGDSGVRVAVLDTGADLDHPDLVGRIVAQTDVVDNDGSAEDDGGHGTHVAGIIAATADNSIGVAGVAPGVSLIVVDIFHWDNNGTPDDTEDDELLATTQDILEGINYSIANSADVINLSLGGYSNDTVEANAIAAAATAGVVVVAAAGNNATSAAIYPGDLDSVICVTATGPIDEFASYSNYGSAKDIAAPGGTGSYASSEQPVNWILSTYPITAQTPTGYAWALGTSMATPVVSGVAALMLSADPTLSVSDLKSKLYSSAVDLGTVGKDIYFGNGRVNAASAVRSVLGISASSFAIDRRTSCLVSVPVGTQLSAVQDALTSSFGTISFYDAQGGTVSGGVAATSMVAQLTDGGVVKDELTLAVKGDANGDGSLSIADYTVLRLWLLNKYSFSVAATVAADVTGDGMLGISDYTDIRLALLNLKPLS
jgi:subtilisin family serine protease